MKNNKKDEAVAQSLSKYIAQKFSSQIEEVKVENDKITIMVTMPERAPLASRFRPTIR